MYGVVNTSLYAATFFLLPLLTYYDLGCLTAIEPDMEVTHGCTSGQLISLSFRAGQVENGVVTHGYLVLSAH